MLYIKVYKMNVRLELAIDYKTTTTSFPQKDGKLFLQSFFLKNSANTCVLI